MEGHKHTIAPPVKKVGGHKGGGADFHLGGGEEDGIAMKCAQSKVKCVCVWGGREQWGPMV